MTKKHLIITIAVIAAIIATIESGLLNALLIFLLVGAIPGTAFSIPPIAMLIAVVAAIIVLTHWVAARQLYPGSPRIKASQDKVLRRTARHEVRRAKTKRTTAKTAEKEYSAAKA